jgi:hypothetical protein
MAGLLRPIETQHEKSVEIHKFAEQNTGGELPALAWNCGFAAMQARLTEFRNFAACLD